MKEKSKEKKEQKKKKIRVKDRRTKLNFMTRRVTSTDNTKEFKLLEYNAKNLMN